jgi:hypothetical protein
MSRQSLSGKVRSSPLLINIELLHEKLDGEKFLLFTEKSFNFVCLLLIIRPHNVKERFKFGCPACLAKKRNFSFPSRSDQQTNLFE